MCNWGNDTMMRTTSLLLIASAIGIGIIATLAALPADTSVEAVIVEQQINPNFTNEELRYIASDDYVETPEEIIARYQSYQYEDSENYMQRYWEIARLQQILPP